MSLLDFSPRIPLGTFSILPLATASKSLETPEHNLAAINRKQIVFINKAIVISPYRGCNVCRVQTRTHYVESISLTLMFVDMWRFLDSVKPPEKNAKITKDKKQKDKVYEKEQKKEVY